MNEGGGATLLFLILVNLSPRFNPPQRGYNNTTNHEKTKINFHFQFTYIY